MPDGGISALAFTALLCGILTPFGWAVLVGAAAIVMLIQLSGAVRAGRMP